LAILFIPVVGIPPSLAGLRVFLRVAATAKDFQVFRRLIPLVPIFVMDVETLC